MTCGCYQRVDTMTYQITKQIIQEPHQEGFFYRDVSENEDRLNFSTHACIF